MTSHPEYGAFTQACTVAASFSTFIKDKVILITGVSNGGIGGATAKALAEHSPHLLILAGRSPEKVSAVIAETTITRPTIRCQYLYLDLASQVSVRAAATAVLTSPSPLHLLINNAAVMNLPTRTLSYEGIEAQFATDHIGPFLFTNLLIPKLLAAVPTSPHNSIRIINLSSLAHTLSPLRFSDINFSLPNTSLPPEEQYLTSTLQNLGLLVQDNHYVPAAAYAQSKSANILFTIALNKRFADKGILNFAVHPGSVESELQRHEDPEVMNQARKRHGIVERRKTLEEGASTALVTALDPALEVVGEKRVYLADCGFGEVAEWCRGEKGMEGAERLWGLSEELVSEKFTW